MRITIAGAGLGGLTAAWELHKQGHDVTVHEAKDRPGGRTWSTRFDNGAVTERGGEYIFPGEFAARRLAAELEIPIMTHGVTYGRRTLRGERPTFEQLSGTMRRAKETLAAMRADGLDRISVADAFREALGAGYEDDPVFRRVAISLIVDPAHASATATLEFESSAVGEYLEDGGHVVGGNQALALEIARRLGDRVVYESPVAGIAQTATGASIALEDGSEREADAVVVAVPLPILRSLEIGFELPEAMRTALEHRTMGVAAKLGVPVRSTDSDTAVQSADGYWWSWRTLDADGEHRIPALSHFAGGERTLEGLGVSGGIASSTEAWVDAVLALRPSTELDGDALLTTWADDPWTRGAYSAATVDWDRRDDEAFTVAAGRVAFAGEHTASAQSISGAVASGYRAAAALGPVLAG